MALEQRPRALRQESSQPCNGDEPDNRRRVVSRMKGDLHVRFDGSGEGQFLPATLLTHRNVGNCSAVCGALVRESFETFA